jgi:hypothetical protein
MMRGCLSNVVSAVVLGSVSVWVLRRLHLELTWGRVSGVAVMCWVLRRFGVLRVGFLCQSVGFAGRWIWGRFRHGGGVALHGLGGEGDGIA